jgi:two-component system OmpR family sensor kinase
MRSLRRRLLLWLLPAAFLAGALASIGTYWGATLELTRQLDDQLRYISEHVRMDGEQVTFDNSNEYRKDLRDDKIDEVLLEIWQGNTLTYSTDRQLQLPAPTSPGLLDVTAGDQTWHTLVSRRGDKLIRVAQAKNARWEALAEVAVHLIWPVLSLLPLLGILLWFGIGHGLKPLRHIAGELSHRDASSMTPLVTERLPVEIKPLTDALNDLLVRLDAAFIAQKHFIADAAHELRTPAMAISIQAQVVQGASNDQERDIALAQLQQGVQRLRHLAEQLLTLARLEPAEIDSLHEVDLTELCRSVVLDRIGLADAKGIDLGLVEGADVHVRGDAEDLRILLNNLIDNAIRYTPHNGRIDVEIRQTGTTIVLGVCDDGPGIAPVDRARVLDRFYRGNHPGISGTGLGLSIVKRVAERHGAAVCFDSGHDGKGLCASVRFVGESVLGSELA